MNISYQLTKIELEETKAAFNSLVTRLYETIPEDRKFALDTIVSQVNAIKRVEIQYKTQGLLDKLKELEL